MQDKQCDICKRRPVEYVVTAFNKGVKTQYEVCEMDYLRLRRQNQLETSKPLSDYFNEGDPLLDLSVLTPEGETFEADNELREIAVTAKDYFELEEFFSEEIPDILLSLVDVARTFGWDVAKSEHLLLALLEQGKIRDLLEEKGVDTEELIEFIEEEAPKGEAFFEPELPEVQEEKTEESISLEVHETLEESFSLSKEYNSDYIYPRHLLLALYTADTLAAQILRKFDLSEDVVREALGY